MKIPGNIDYKILVEKSSEGVVVAQEGRIVYVNEKFCKLLKYKREAILNKSILNFIHPEDGKLVLERHKKRLAGGKPPSVYEFRLLSSKKVTMYFNVNSSRIMWNKKPATLSYMTDISKLKEREHKERQESIRIRGFFEVAEVLIFSLSKNQKIEYINRKGCEILECEEKDAIGKNWFDNFIPKANVAEVKRVFNLLMAGRVKMVENYENPILTFKGNEKIISWHNSILRDEKGRPTHIISSGEDITEKKKSERKLEESEQRFRSVFENSPDIIYLKDKNLRYIMANSQTEKVLGQPLSKIIGKKDSEILKTKDDNAEIELEKEVLSGKSYRGEKTVVIKGQRKYFSVTKTPIRDGKMNIIGFSAIERDVTERKTKEKELYLKNRLNNDILGSNPIGIFVVDENGNVEYVNKSMLNISSADYDRFMALNMLKHKQYRKLGISNNIKDALKKGKNFRMEKVEYTSTVGKKTTVRNFIGVPLEEEGYKKVLIMVEDITEHLLSEKKISEQNNFLMTIIDSLSYPFYVIDPSNYKLLLANKAATKNKKLENCYELAHDLKKPCNSKEHICPIKEIIRNKKPVVTEHVHSDGNGQNKYVEVHGYPIFGEGGKVDKIIEYSIDVSERKEAENKIKEQEERFKDILDGAHDLIQSISTNGKVIYVNKAWKDALGYSDEEIKNLNVFEIIHPADIISCQTEFREILSGKALGNLETRFRTKKGGYIKVNGAVSCKFENGKPVSTRGIFRDVTRQYIEQEELRKRTAEIEKFNKLAVDRELKMVELKKIIKDMESRLKDKNM